MKFRPNFGFLIGFFTVLMMGLSIFAIHSARMDLSQQTEDTHGDAMIAINLASLRQFVSQIH